MNDIETEEQKQATQRCDEVIRNEARELEKVGIRFKGADRSPSGNLNIIYEPCEVKS